MLLTLACFLPRFVAALLFLSVVLDARLALREVRGLLKSQQRRSLDRYILHIECDKMVRLHGSATALCGDSCCLGFRAPSVSEVALAAL